MLSAQQANRRYFREAYRTGRHGWAVLEPSSFVVRFLRRLRRHLPGGRLLDLGCGEGRHSFAAAQMGFRVTAVDYEPLALRRARRFANAKKCKTVIFREANVFRLPFPDSSFDIVVDCGCLHHQRKSDWPAYRASLLRILKPEGFYVLMVFSPRFRLFRGSRRPWHIAFGAYRRRFTARDLVEVFGRDFVILTMTEERGKDGGFWHALLKRRA